MNTKSLFYFVEAAKDMNFTQTAKRLYISIEQKNFSVRADGEVRIEGKAPEEREFSIISQGDFSINSLYAIKIK